MAERHPRSPRSRPGWTIPWGISWLAALRGERLWRIPLLDAENTGTPTNYYVGQYGRLRTIVKVPGADQLWLTTTNCDNNGNQPDGSDNIFRITIS